MFRTHSWLPTKGTPMLSDFFNSRFNFLMTYQQGHVKQSYESALESERHKEERVMQELSAELTRQKHDELVDKKLRQKLNEESAELRELKGNLRVAQVSMQLTNQKAQFDLNRRHAERARTLGRERAETECRRELEYTRDVRNAYRQKQQELRSALLSQMAEHQSERNQRQQQVLVERDRRYELQRQIELEDVEKQREQLQQKIKTRVEMFKSMSQQSEQKALRRIQKKDENKQYFEHACQVHEARLKAKAEKLREIAEQQEKSARIGAYVFAIEDGKRQREQLLLDLLQKEHQNKMDREYREQLDKELKERRQTKQELDRARMEHSWKNEQIAQDKTVEAAQAREAGKLVDPMLEVERLQASHEKRKRHGSVLINMMADNRRKRAAVAAEHAQFVEQKEKVENDRQKMILEERIKLLQSIPPDALRYLRNGVLTKTDVDHLEGPSKLVASEICHMSKIKSI